VRRVFATTLLRAREEVDMPAPGDPRPARHAVAMTDLVWTGIYVRIGDLVGALATRANRLQFLTIRRYLSLVFLSLVLLLLGLALWS
jgi:hydrogenase-4 component B